eukprot:gene25634-11292_t
MRVLLLFLIVLGDPLSAYSVRSTPGTGVSASPADAVPVGSDIAPEHDILGDLSNTETALKSSAQRRLTADPQFGLASSGNLEDVQFRWAQVPDLVLSAPIQATSSSTINNPLVLADYVVGGSSITNWNIYQLPPSSNQYYITLQGSRYAGTTYFGNEGIGTVSYVETKGRGTQSKWYFTQDTCFPDTYYISNLDAADDADVMCITGVQLTDGVSASDYVVKTSLCTRNYLTQRWTLWGGTTGGAVAPLTFASMGNSTAFYSNVDTGCRVAMTVGLALQFMCVLESIGPKALRHSLWVELGVHSAHQSVRDMSRVFNLLGNDQRPSCSEFNYEAGTGDTGTVRRRLLRGTYGLTPAMTSSLAKLVREVWTHKLPWTSLLLQATPGEEAGWKMGELGYDDGSSMQDLFHRHLMGLSKADGEVDSILRQAYERLIIIVIIMAGIIIIHWLAYAGGHHPTQLKALACPSL